MNEQANTSEILWAADSHVGLRRSNNEDFYLPVPEAGLWIVCDGMGGHADGEKASRLCAETVAAEIKKGTDLTAAIQEAHNKVKALADDTGPSKPGTTVTALLIRDNAWKIAWVGDSRIWMFDKDFKQISSDHTIVQQLVDWGEITLEDAKKHPDRHKLRQALGAGCDKISIGKKSGQRNSKQTFLLATDGMAFWDKPEKIIEILRESDDHQQAIKTLIQASLDDGGKDNVTIAIIGCKQQQPGLKDRVFNTISNWIKK